jgi:hypothetical protein
MDNDACGTDDNVVVDASPWRIPRDQPWNVWLFAVALGMQEQMGSAVARSLVPLAVGHALTIAIVVLAAALLNLVMPLTTIRYCVAALLVGLGIYSLVKHWHPRWVRMQVGFRDLTFWSFLMASAHGAGLMVLPFLLGSGAVEASDQMTGPNHMAAGANPLAGMLASLVHTTPYLAVTGALACSIGRSA